MYAFIQGVITFPEPMTLVIEANGVGYELKASLHTNQLLKGRTEAKVLTHLIVKEDSHTLYGFATEEERLIFKALISVSGVGPGTALTALSSMSPAEVADAIVRGNAKILQSIKGLGAKTAERIVLELKDKLSKTFNPLVGPVKATGSNSNAVNKTNNAEEALLALLALGIPKAAAEKNIEQVIKTDGALLTVEEIIKRALRSK